MNREQAEAIAESVKLVARTQSAVTVAEIISNKVSPELYEALEWAKSKLADDFVKAHES